MAAHRVNVLEIELAAGDVDLAESLIERTGQLHERRIAPILDRVFDEFSGPGRLDRIDRLELDLGHLAVDDFDNDFARKLEDALRRALSRALHDRRGRAPTEASRELLALFARTGNLPWWADRTDDAAADPVAAAFASLLREAPGELVDLLRELADDPLAQARLARHCDDSTLAPLVERRWPGAGGELLVAARWLARHCDDSSLAPLVEHRSPGPGGEPLVAARWLARPLADVAPAATRLVRRGLLAALPRPGAPADAVRSLVSGLAAATHRSERALIARLAQEPDLPALLRAIVPPAAPSSPDREAMPEQTGSKDHPSASHPDESALSLSAEFDAAPPRSTDPLSPESIAPRSPDDESTDSGSRVPEPHADLARPLELLTTFARTGDLPPTASDATVAAAFTTLAREAPRELLALLRALAGDALARLAPHCDDSSLAALASRRWLAPTDEWQAALRWLAPDDPLPLRHALLAALARPAVDGPLAAVRSLLADLDDRRALARLAVDPAPPALLRDLLDPASPPPSEPSADVQAARRRARDQLDELYVDDAGLVILWPFLARYFERLDLLDAQRQFLDEPARTRAIAALRHLAAEDPDPPEFALPLSKLMCGAAPGAEFMLMQPLAPELLAEGERLLAAAIDHVPVLHDMSVAGFRATFLRRPGVLVVRDGAWLLRVERATHDLVLERFPWSWSWLKLPWMPDPLHVEW